MVFQKLFPIVVATLFFTTAPTIAQDFEKEKTKMEEVMDTHDQVMDRMPELSKLISKLETKADASYQKQKYCDAIKDLKAVSKSMIDWMTGFGNHFEADEMMKGKPLSEKKQK